MAHGVEKRPIFENDAERQSFLATLKALKDQCGASVFAYCLMTTHFHLAVKIGLVPLATLMHRLMARHAARFNWLHDRRGHLFDGRYKAKLCLDDRYLATIIKYIHLNPVEARIVDEAAAWHWSSYRSYKDGEDDGLVTPVRYLPDCEIPPDFDPWAEPDPPPQTTLLRRDGPPKSEIEPIIAAVCAEVGVSLEPLMAGTKTRQVCEARATIIKRAAACGIRPAEIAASLGISRASVSCALWRKLTI